jgi:MFS transporter, ACS family, glucarate transporter
MSHTTAPTPTTDSQLTTLLDAGPKPTRVRYLVVAFLAGMTFILYLDRVCISQAATSIKKDLDISNTRMGWILAAFTISYALFEIPTGRWGDKYGSRRVLTRIVLWWSFFTALTGAATGFGMLLGIRFLFGAGEAGALPNSARVLRQWFPEASRGRAQGFVVTAMMLGGALANVVSQKLINAVDWRWTFVIFGLLGILWALSFYLWFRDNPADHSMVNQGEIDFIKSNQGAATPLSIDKDLIAPDLVSEEGTAHGPIPWKIVFRSPDIWLLSCAMICMTAFYYLLISWYPTYLQEGRGATKDQSSWLTSMVLGAGATGTLLGGWFSDWFVKRSGSRRWGRTTQCVVGTVIASTFIFLSLRTDDTTLSAIFVAIACFAHQVQTPAWWACATLVSGKHLGALFGMMNMIGALGGIFSQVFFGYYADYMKGLGHTGRAQWDPAVYLYILVPIVGMTLWSFINPERCVDDIKPAAA